MKLELTKSKGFQGRKGPVLLVIMDGVGIGKQNEANAVYKANTPNLDKLFNSKLYTQLNAHGPAVGLPSDGDMGNSEVGHNALGAGRVFAQGAKLVDNSIKTGQIFESDLWKTFLKKGQEGKTVHFMGLLSDGNVHSHINHLFALINNCAENGVKKLRIHALLDGRDVGEKSALEYIRPTQELLDKISKEKGFDYNIASGGGKNGDHHGPLRSRLGRC